MGAQLPTEHALCRCYRVSRFIVREAMSMLSAAGPVRRGRHGGDGIAERALPTASASRRC